MTFLKNAPEVRKRQRDKNERERERQNPTAFSIISHQNVQLLENEFERWLKEAMPDKSFSCFPIPFGQASAFLLDKRNKLWRSPSKIRVCIDSLDAIVGVDWLDPLKTKKFFPRRLGSPIPLIRQEPIGSACWSTILRVLTRRWRPRYASVTQSRKSPFWSRRWVPAQTDTYKAFFLCQITPKQLLRGQILILKHFEIVKFLVFLLN